MPELCMNGLVPGMSGLTQVHQVSTVINHINMTGTRVNLGSTGSNRDHLRLHQDQPELHCRELGKH